MNPVRQNRIPTADEFEAASKRMKLLISREQELKNAICLVCCEAVIFHDAYVWLSNGECRIDLFLNTDADVASQLALVLREAVQRRMAAMLGEQQPIVISIDSH